jgi:DNA-binding MarR family transcriptional regulator
MATSTLFSNSEEHPGYYLWQTAMRWQKTMNQELLAHSLTYTQYIILFTIHRLKDESEPLTQVTIASVCSIDTMMVSKVLKTLIEKKLVTRKESKIDTRAKIVSLTVLGESTLRHANISVESADSQFFATLGNFSESFFSALEQLSL